jgi:chromosome partitioning protein
VTKTVIRTNVRLAEAPSHGKNILQYDSSSRGARDFRSLAREIAGGSPITPFEEMPIPLPPPEEAS